MSEVLFQLSNVDADFTIFTYDVSDNEDDVKKVLLRVKTPSAQWHVLLDSLPVPGYFDTTKPTSTHDVRGTIDIIFKLVRQDTTRSIVEMSIDTESEEWYYGSFDDSWRRREPGHEVSYLVFKSHPTLGILVYVCYSLQDAERF